METSQNPRSRVILDRLAEIEVGKDARERIIAAANELFAQSGRADFPTVDAVRRLAKANMNDASAVMKEWRRMQTATAAPVAVTVPDRVQQASSAALAALWSEAQEIANASLNSAQTAWDAERAEAEKLRVELSSAFEAQAGELELLQNRFAELEARAAEAAGVAGRQIGALQTQLTELHERAGTAEARAVEIERRADDLKAAMTAAQDSAQATARELDAERKRHEATASRLDAAMTELATAKARVDAEREAHAEHGRRAAEDADRSAERIARAENQREEARKETSAAREEAAKLRGRIEAMETQQAELMRAITGREVGQSVSGNEMKG